MILPFQILVTRPSPQGEALCVELKKHGFDSVFLPVMKVQPLTNETLTREIHQLNEYTTVIFLSRHAVAVCAPLIQQIWPVFPATTKIIAVGEGTAQALEQAGLVPVIYPSQWSTEGLLGLSELQEVKEQKIALLTGKDGREALAQKLQERGAKVNTIISYKRVLPVVNMHPYYKLLVKRQIHAIVCTSVQGVIFLKKLFSKAASWQRLRKIPLVLVSERIMIQAKEQGFETCYLAADASHDSIVQVLQKLRGLSMSEENKPGKNSAITVDASVSSPKRVRTVWSWLLLLGFIGVGAFGVYSSNKSMQQSLMRVSRELQADQQQILLLNNRLIELQRKLPIQEAAIQQQNQALASKPQAKNLANFLFAQHWAELGHQYLMLTADIPRTINFLSQAEKEIDKVTGLRIISIKQALAQDIATLKNLPWVDPAELYLRLLALQKEITQLPILLVPVQETTAVPGPNLPTTESAWKRGLYSTWETLRKMVVVHHLPAPGTPPFILPDQHPYIYQNLYNTFDQAIWAVMHQEANVYHASLSQAQEWINQYFLLSSLQTKAALDEIAKLQAISIQPAKGIVLTAPKAFQDYYIEIIESK